MNRFRAACPVTPMLLPIPAQDAPERRAWPTKWPITGPPRRRDGQRRWQRRWAARAGRRAQAGIQERHRHHHLVRISGGAASQRLPSLTATWW